MPPPEAYPHQPEADSFQFKGAIEIVRRAVAAHRWVVLTCVAATTLIVGTYIHAWPPTYQATVVLAADSDKDVQRTAFYQGWNTFRQDATLSDEAALMTSAPVLREVIARLDLKYEDVYHPFFRYAVHLWAQSWIGSHYRRAKLWILGDEASPSGMSAEQIERYRVLSDFEEGVSVKQVGEASIGLLTVKGSNLRVAEIANTLATVYLAQRRERYLTEARQSRDSLLEESERTRRELDAFDLEVKKFRVQSGAVLLFEKDKGQIAQYLVQRAAVTDLEALVAENTAALQVINRQLEEEGSKLRSDKLFIQDAYKNQLPKLEADLVSARQLFQPDSREVRDLEAQIKAARASIDAGQSSTVVRNSVRVSDTYETLMARRLAIESTLKGNLAALKIKNDELTRIRALLDQIPEKMQVNHEFERRQQALENKYAGINEKLSVAEVSMATAKTAPAALRVVDVAHVPDQPIWPQTKLLMLAAVLTGAIVGVVVALMLEISLERVSRNRLLRNSGKLRLLGVVDQDEKFLQRLFPSFGSGN